MDRAEHPERTLEFSFRQVPGGTGMMLTIKNPLPQMVKYRAGMMMLDDPKDGAVYATSSCPVPPGLSAFESWPEPIFQLVLADFRVQQGSDLRCE